MELDKPGFAKHQVRQIKKYIRATTFIDNFLLKAFTYVTYTGVFGCTINEELTKNSAAGFKHKCNF
jgi:hypothetical protein